LHITHAEALHAKVHPDRGPGSGKTVIIRQLELEGFRYPLASTRIPALLALDVAAWTTTDSS
jgi:hypothetical protein